MLKVLSVIALAALVVVIVIALDVTDFAAYLGDDPVTCNNCHVMDAVYEGWRHTGHQAWAACVDCHTPHEFIPKYYVKALSGYHHVTAFLSGNIPDAIRARESSLEVVQENCIRCHAAAVETILLGPQPFDRYCWDCHSDVSHGEPGLSLYPDQQKEEGK